MRPTMNDTHLRSNCRAIAEAKKIPWKFIVKENIFDAIFCHIHF